MAHKKFKRPGRRRYIGRRAAGIVAARQISRGNRSYSNANIFRFKRKNHETVSVTYNGVASESHGAFKFTLADLPNYTEFTSLFDKYRISGIRAQFIPRTNVLAQNDLGATLTAQPTILTVVDYDDASAAEDYDALMQYENCRVHNQFRPFTVYFKPQIAIATYSGAFTSYGSSRNMWLDAASTGVEYYALKWATLPYSTGNNTTPDPVWDVIFTYYIQCKYPR